MELFLLIMQDSVSARQAVLEKRVMTLSNRCRTCAERAGGGPAAPERSLCQLQALSLLTLH